MEGVRAAETRFFFKEPLSERSVSRSFFVGKEDFCYFDKKYKDTQSKHAEKVLSTVVVFVL